jgi:hypothetical protein
MSRTVKENLTTSTPDCCYVFLILWVNFIWSVLVLRIIEYFHEISHACAVCQLLNALY